jgi:hypothetical protein
LRSSVALPPRSKQISTHYKKGPGNLIGSNIFIAVTSIRAVNGRVSLLRSYARTPLIVHFIQNLFYFV